MHNKFFITVLLSALILPVFVRADAPPPPPFTVSATYEGQTISDQKFYAVLLTCQKLGEDNTLQGRWSSSEFQRYYKDLQDNGEQNTPEYKAYTKLDISQINLTGACTWKAYFLPSPKYCTNSGCLFNYILGDYKVATYIPSLDKTFISNDITRRYSGYYGRETVRSYALALDKSGGAKLAETGDTSQDYFFVATTTIATTTYDTYDVIGDFEATVISSLFITLILELLVVLVFALIKKAPKIILLGVLLGNIISVPLLWILVSHYYWLLFPAEILVVIFEACLIKLFGKGKISWKMCLLISLIMNLVSFLFGPILFNH
jgi:hypothetical protein